MVLGWISGWYQCPFSKREVPDLTKPCSITLLMHVRMLDKLQCHYKWKILIWRLEKESQEFEYRTDIELVEGEMVSMHCTFCAYLSWGRQCLPVQSWH